MLYRIDLSWSDSDKIKQLTEEEYEKLRNAVFCLPQSNKNIFGLHDLIIDVDGISALIELGVTPVIKQLKNTYSPSKPSNGWTHIADNIKNSVHVHIPNIGLLMIDEVMVLEDSCTDYLQNKLDDGWRIIAVCPPNGVRRPDYVLGRKRNTE